MKALLAIALLLFAGPLCGAPAPQLKVGKPFPMLQLPLAGPESGSASIMDYRGRKLMLHLFASW